MGLLGGMARTAVVAGTATAVSNRVSRRQAGRWAQQDQQQYERAAAVRATAAAVRAATAGRGAVRTTLAQLQKLGELRASGVLTEEEFAAEKAKILGR